MKKALVTTAFPYLNGKLHLGHKYSYFIYEAISRILTSSGYQVLKPFSFHTTGISLISRPQRYLTDQSIPSQIRKEISKGNWNPLLDYYKKDLLFLFNKSGILTDSKYYQYTHDSKRYLCFLDSCFKRLVPFIEQKNHNVIYCNKCKVVLGEHDRATGESAIIVENPIIEKHYLVPGTSFYLSEKVICKCSSVATVKEIEDWFLDYHKLVSRESFIENIKELSEDVTKVLLNKYDILKPWCITRDKGLGPRYLFDNTKILEPLTDSTLYPFYYLLKNKKNPVVEDLLEVEKSYFENHYHIIGKDLIENHMLFMILWEIYFLGRRTTFFIITGHLQLKGQKMSKTKGNIIPYDTDLFSIEEAFWSNNSYRNFSNSFSLPKDKLPEKLPEKNTPNTKLTFTRDLFYNRNSEYHRIKRRITYGLAQRETISFKHLTLNLEEEEDKGFYHNETRIKELRVKINNILKRKRRIKEIQIPAFYLSYIEGNNTQTFLNELLEKNIKEAPIVRRIISKPFILLE